LALFSSWASGFSIKVKDAQNNIEANQQTNQTNSTHQEMMAIGNAWHTSQRLDEATVRWGQ
jgi:transcription initiation factor TFIID subunit TAF12